MTDPQKLHSDATHIVLHAWVTAYLAGPVPGVNDGLGRHATSLQSHVSKLQESSLQLAAALEKMRVANAKLALRMAEHKAFFSQYKAP